MIRRRGIGAWAALLTIHLAGTGANASAQQPVRFDTHGGDAWTFSKDISGTVSRDRCDSVVVVVDSLAPNNAHLAEGRFTTTVRLHGGHNRISAICLSTGKPVGSIARQSWNVRLPDVPTAHTKVTVEGDVVLIDAGTSTVAPATPAPLIRYSWLADPTNPAPLEVQSAVGPKVTTAHGPLLLLRSPMSDGDYRVSLIVSDAAGRTSKATALFRVAGRKAQAVDLLHEHPDWRACAILYGVTPALFGNRGLAGVTQHLDQISSLGVTALWLSPVTGAPQGDFGYALTDPFRVRKSLGSPAELRTLIAQAHARGMAVLLDFVTNHLAKEHPYFEDTVHFGRRSPYFNWFERDRNGQAVHYFDWSSLENLNYSNVEVRNYILAAVAHWFRDFPIDGFRADAAWAVRQREPAFWPIVRQEVENVRPQALLLAEASARDPYYMSHGFDAAYDWTAELGHWAWQGVFGPEGKVPNLRLLRAALSNDGRGFADNAGVLHFLNNNDTGKRFIDTHGAADTRLAAALLLTLPGIPLIYAGDEVGASFEPYAHPRPIDWSDDPDHLMPLYTRLIKLRREIPALRSQILRVLHTNRDDSVLAYIRAGKEPSEDVTVVLNFGTGAISLPLAAIEAAQVPAASWWAEDLLAGTRTVAPPEVGSIRVPAHGALLLRRAAAGHSEKLNSFCPAPRFPG